MGAKQAKPEQEEVIVPAQSDEIICKSAQTSAVLPTDALFEEAAQSGFLPDCQIAWIIDDLVPEQQSAESNEI